MGSVYTPGVRLPYLVEFVSVSLLSADNLGVIAVFVVDSQYRVPMPEVAVLTFTRLLAHQPI